ncbi:hypothetical protein C8R45DRAFT_927078 [Mycena sanguinolenta]|nr:hypothetical protein C8R45DRAFT_927078 [Mycena sanguinolenta]
MVHSCREINDLRQTFLPCFPWREETFGTLAIPVLILDNLLTVHCLRKEFLADVFSNFRNVMATWIVNHISRSERNVITCASFFVQLYRRYRFGSWSRVGYTASPIGVIIDFIYLSSSRISEVNHDVRENLSRAATVLDLSRAQLSFNWPISRGRIKIASFDVDQLRYKALAGISSAALRLETAAEDTCFPLSTVERNPQDIGIDSRTTSGGSAPRMNIFLNSAVKKMVARWWKTSRLVDQKRSRLSGGKWQTSHETPSSSRTKYYRLTRARNRHISVYSWGRPKTRRRPTGRLATAKRQQRGVGGGKKERVSVPDVP